MDDMREQFGDSTRIGCTLWIGECMGVKTSMLMRSGHAFCWDVVVGAAYLHLVSTHIMKMYT
jgi:hypothetical protein